MSLRSLRERLLQTALYEAGAFLLILPLYAAVSGSGLARGSAVVLAVILAEVIWSPLHNTLFDLVDLRRSGRPASARPLQGRLLHALSHEVSLMAVTVPVLMILGGHGLAAAVALDLGLTVVCMGYAFGFHLGYDLLRPVGAGRGAPAGRG